MLLKSDGDSDAGRGSCDETLYLARAKETCDRHGTSVGIVGVGDDSHAGILPVQIYVSGVLFMAGSYC